VQRRILIAGCGTGTLGVLVFALLPLMLGGFADALFLDDAAIGWLGSAYVGGYTVVTAAAFLWVNRVSWHIVFAGGALLMGAGFALAAINLDYHSAIVALAISGLGAGFLYALSVAIVSRLDEVDRAFAIKMVPEQTLPALLLVALPALVVARFGVTGVLTVTACIALLGLALLPLVPRRESNSPSDTEAGSGIGLAFAALLGLLMFFGGIAGVWAFAERLLVEAGIDRTAAGQMLAIGVIASAVGPLTVAIVGDRFGRLWPLLVTLAVVVVSLLALADKPSTVGYAVLMFSFPAAWYAGMAYQMGIVADADHSGKYSVLIAAALGVGATIGPAAYGEIKGAFDVLAANTAAAGMATGGILLSAWVTRRSGLPIRNADR
jgi:predicted MFS family arabinose efflux permease